MEILNLIIALISGAAGGNVAGAAIPDKSLGAVGNTISGLLGGGLGAFILQALDLFNKAGGPNAVNAAGTATGLDLPSILASIGSGGVGGGVLMAVIGLIKNAMEKKT